MYLGDGTSIESCVHVVWQFEKQKFQNLEKMQNVLVAATLGFRGGQGRDGLVRSTSAKHRSVACAGSRGKFVV